MTNDNLSIFIKLVNDFVYRICQLTYQPVTLGGQCDRYISSSPDTVRNVVAGS